MRNLQATRFSPAYQRRLDDSWSDFTAFLGRRAEGLEPEDLSASAKLANAWMCRYLQHLYETDSAKKLSQARHAILALEKRLRELKGQMTESWEAYESWRQEVPGQLRAPLFLPAMLAMAVTARMLAQAADGYEGYLWAATSVLLEAGFFGLLRPGELTAATRGLTALPGQLLGNAASFAVIGVDCPKNKRQLGRFQFAIVRSANASAWVAWLCQDLMDSERLWPSTASEFRRRFKTLLWYLGLSELNFVPASLRAGGATYLFMHGVDPPRLKFYGRWVSERALSHYLQESMTFQLAHSAPVRSQRLVALALRGGAHLLSPPSLPPTALFERRPTRGGLAAKVANAQERREPKVQVPAARTWEHLYPPPSCTA